MQNVITLKKNQTPDDLLTLNEIETKFKIKYNTAYKLIVLNSKIPYYRIGRTIRVSEKDFLTYLNNCWVASSRCLKRF